MWEPSKDVSARDMAVSARECSRRLQVSKSMSAGRNNMLEDKSVRPLFSEYFILTLYIYGTEFVIG